MMKTPVSILLFLVTSFVWGDQNSTFIGKVIPSGDVDLFHFGSAVSVWEDLSVVGAPNADAVYVYREEHNGSRTPIEKLTPPDGGSNTQFGVSVSLSDGIIAVGAKWSDQGGHSNSGAAYLYQVLPDGTLLYLHKVTAHDANATDCFGSSVSFSHGILAVGAPSDNHSGRNDAGSAYVYRLEHNGSLSPLAKLTASDANASDNFGHSVSTSYGLVAVGAPSHNHDGAAYLYWQEENGSFLQIAKLLDPNANYAPGGEGVGFGRAVSLAGDRLAISSIGEDVASVAYDVGAVYLFSIEDGTPHLLDEVFAPISDMHNSAHFGNSLSLSYELLAVGAQNNNHGGHTQAGAAYLYRIEDNGTAGLIKKFVADDANASDKFGSSVALSYDTLVVGAHKNDYWGNTDAGTVYYYDSWAAANRAPSDIRPDPFLGFSMQKEELIHDLQTGWLKAVETMVFDAYGWTVDPNDEWSVNVLEDDDDPNPLYFLFEFGPNDEANVTDLNFHMPALQLHLDSSFAPVLLAQETLRMLLHKNTYHDDVTGDGISSGAWFKYGLSAFLVGGDHQVELLLDGEPSDAEIAALLAEVGDGETVSNPQQAAASYLAVRYLDFRLKGAGITGGVKHMTQWMKSQFDNAAGAANSGINHYVATQSGGFSLTEFKGQMGLDFVKNHILPKLDNNDNGSVLGGDVTGGPNLDWNSVVPDLYGAHQSNVQYEIDEWTNLLEFEEESPIGAVVARFQAVDPDDHGIGWKGYDLIDHGSNISWTAAKAAADAADAADPFHWVYLATVTSEAEHNLTAHLVAQAGLHTWLGASDSAVEGEWRWTEGPEGQEAGGQGLQFWQGFVSGHSVNGLYENWDSSNPDNDNDNQHHLKLKSSLLWDDAIINGAASAYLLESDQILTHVYSLVSGYGDNNNSLFSLASDGTLRTATEFDYENNASSYSIRVRVTDELNASFEKPFYVDLLDVDEDPDKDGLPNDVDLDDDGDGYSDAEELAASSNPLSIWSIPPVAKVIRVDDNASGNKDGTSWVDAYDNLQAALAEADGITRTQIWVAEGVYKPDLGPGQTRNDRTSTFQLKNRLQIIGGFKGHENSESDRTDNGWISWLSGDIGGENWFNDNSYHVVNASGVDRSAQLSNFVIAYGRADGPGQWGKRGAGILANNGSPSLQGLAFIHNVAEGSQSGGGGIAVYNGGSPSIYSCLFQANSAEWGGAIKLSMGSSGVFYNTLAYGNQADKGGAMVVWESNATVTHSTFSDNNASDGGALYAGSDSNVTFNNTIAWGNTALSNPAGSINSSSAVSHHSLIEGGHGDLADTDPLFVDPLYNDFRLRLGSPMIDAGELSFVGFLYLDFSNVSRTEDLGPDIGAFEGAVDVVDLGGQVSYSGAVENGPFRVRLIDQWGSTIKEKSMAHPGLFSFVVQRGLSYKVKAFLDTNADGWPNEDEPWAYHHHSPIQVNAARTDFDVNLGDTLPEQNATVSGRVFYDGTVPGSLIVRVFDDQGELVGEEVLEENTGFYSFTLDAGEYDVMAFRDGNENFELDDQWEVGEPFAHLGEWNEETESFDLLPVDGNVSNADIEIILHGDHDGDGISDWEEYVADLGPFDYVYAFFPLDEDSWEQEHSQVVHGAVPAANRFGEEGMALFFDGEDDYVEIEPLELGSEYTLSVWVHPEEQKGGGYFNVLSNNGNPVWGVREANLRQYLFGRVEGGEGSGVVRHEWTYLTLVRDGDAHTLYQDGVEVAEEMVESGPDVFSIIGAYLPFASALDDREPFHGYLDDLIVWKRPLTPAEVFEVYDEESLSLREGLLAFYFFDGNESEAMGYERHGVVHGAVPAPDRFGDEGMALFFDGEDDYVEIDPLELGHEYTLSVWVHPEEQKGGGYFNVLSNKGNPVWGLREGNLRQYLFGRVEGGEGSGVVRHDWTHLTLVRDGSAHTLYQNGVKVAEEMVESGPDVFSIIGAYLPFASALSDREPFHGMIDDLIVWERALSVDEVEILFALETETYEPGAPEGDLPVLEQEDLFAPLVRTEYPEEDSGAFWLGGQILADGGAPVLEAGILVSRDIFFEDDFALPAEMGPEDERFYVRFDDLEPGVLYYYRTYAINAVGESLGSIRKFRAREGLLFEKWWAEMPEMGEGWRYSEWFGEFRRFEGADWIYHGGLGWLFVVPDEEGGLWLWQEEYGWLWTRQGAMPYLWAERSGGWLYLYGSSDGQPVIYFFD